MARPLLDVLREAGRPVTVDELVELRGHGSRIGAYAELRRLEAAGDAARHGEGVAATFEAVPPPAP